LLNDLEVEHEILNFHRQKWRNEVEIPFEERFNQKIMAKQAIYPKKPSRVLESIAYQNDPFLHLLSWSNDSDILGIGLKGAVQLQDLTSGRTAKIKVIENAASPPPIGNFLTAIRWANGGQELITADAAGTLYALDAREGRQIAKYVCSDTRITAISQAIKDTFAVASASHSIHLADKRVQDAIPFAKAGEGMVYTLAHTSRMPELLASSTDTGDIKVFDLRRGSSPLYMMKHQESNDYTCLRALEWSPYQHGVLISGWNNTSLIGINVLNSDKHGYAGDKKEDFLWEVDTKSEVTELMCLPERQEIVTGHGGSSPSIQFWTPSMRLKGGIRKAHMNQVLHLAINPGYNQLISAGADYTIKFWALNSDQPEDPAERQTFNVHPVCRSLLLR
jgi:WD40 repeat protein